MKIIFDSEEQKRNFEEHFIADYCPSILRLTDFCEDVSTCEECWKQALEMEVKNE